MSSVGATEDVPTVEYSRVRACSANARKRRPSAWSARALKGCARTRSQGLTAKLPKAAGRTIFRKWQNYGSAAKPCQGPWFDAASHAPAGPTPEMALRARRSPGAAPSQPWPAVSAASCAASTMRATAAASEFGVSCSLLAGCS